MTLSQLKGLEALNEICLTEAEEALTLGVFASMEEGEALLEGLGTENAEPMVYVMPLQNVLREDVREQPFTREQLLEGAPEHTDECWQVPRLVK